VHVTACVFFSLARLIVSNYSAWLRSVRHRFERGELMRRKLAALVASVISVGTIMIGLPASARDLPPPYCDSYRYSVLAGQGISVFCDYLPYPPYLYRVVAHCAAGSSFWYELGYWVEPGFGPSSAECQGNLLNAARVVGYHVDER
jgi:hypothetical protein